MEYTVTIQFSDDPDVEPVTYAFASAAEQAAFLLGVDEGCGWLDYTILSIVTNR